MRTKRIWMVLLGVVLASLAFGQGSPRVVASTNWVAAFARAAGALDVTVIAPASVQHPPDYDPRPSDLAAIARADWVLLAGYEGFAKRMEEALGGGRSEAGAGEY